MLFIPSSQETATGVSESQLHSHTTTMTVRSRSALESKNSKHKDLLTSSNHPLTRSYTEQDESCARPHSLFKIHSNIIFPPTHHPPSSLFPSDFLEKIVYAFHIHPIQVTCPTHPFSFTESSYRCAIKSTNYEAPSYIIFSFSWHPLPLHYLHILFSALSLSSPLLRTHIYTTFHTRTKQPLKLHSNTDVLHRPLTEMQITSKNSTNRQTVERSLASARTSQITLSITQTTRAT